MFNLFDWDEQLEEDYRKIQELHSNSEKIRQTQNQESDKLRQLHADVINLAKEIGISLENILDTYAESSYKTT